MNTKLLAALAVVLAAGGVVLMKIRQRPADAVTAHVASPSVVLVADPREADSDCPCGQIIRLVREAKARGVVVRELGPTDPGAARFGVTVAPTVLILAADGQVVARREGESSEALATISSDLARLEGRTR